MLTRYPNMSSSISISAFSFTLTLSSDSSIMPAIFLGEMAIYMPADETFTESLMMMTKRSSVR